MLLILKPQTVVGKNFLDLLKVAQPGDIISLYNGWCQNWGACHGGVIVENFQEEHGRRLLLNGEKVLYDGPWDDWEPCLHENNVVIRTENRFFLPNGNQFYNGDWFNWCPYPGGVAIRLELDGKFFLNGDISKLLYDGKFERIEGHPKGFVIELDGSILLINGTEKKVLYDGPMDDWRIDCDGNIIIRQGNKLLLSNGVEIYKSNPNSWEGALEKWDDWDVHPKGIIGQANDRIFFIVCKNIA